MTRQFLLQKGDFENGAPRPKMQMAKALLDQGTATITSQEWKRPFPSHSFIVVVAKEMRVLLRDRKVRRSNSFTQARGGCVVSLFYQKRREYNQIHYQTGTSLAKRYELHYPNNVKDLHR